MDFGVGNYNNDDFWFIDWGCFAISMVMNEQPIDWWNVSNCCQVIHFMIHNPLCRRRYYSIHYPRITAENQMKSIKQRKLLHFKPINILFNRLIPFQSLFIIECVHYYTSNRNIGLRQYTHDSVSWNLKPYTQLVYFKNNHRWQMTLLGETLVILSNIPEIM